mgnify:CR=1 FL=1
MKHLNLPAEYKAAGDTGSFSGYASMFGNVDLGGDVIERGAFKEIVSNGEGKVATLWMHDMRQPIGVSTVRQDDKGLAFEGHLVLEDPTARKVLAHMKAGSVRGMSIGFDILEGGAKIMESGIRMLTALKLWEISVVTFGMNPLAQVLDAKGAISAITNIRECEDFLREVGFSATQAKRLASGGWKALSVGREAPTQTADEDVKSIISFLEKVGTQ